MRRLGRREVGAGLLVVLLGCNNGLDDDCDGTPDAPPVSGEGGWYADADGDGFGDDASAACVAADGFVEVAGDCDDGDGSVNPDATEVCNDGSDNDCDGGPGPCVWDTTVDMTDELTISPVGVDEGFGYRGVAADLDADGTDEIVLAGLTGLTEPLGTYAGYLAIFDTPIAENLTTSQAAWHLWGGSSASSLGSTVLAHDVNGDGFTDLQVGTSTLTLDGVEWVGGLYTLYGPLDSTTEGFVDEVADERIAGSIAEEFVGRRGYLLGDLDGDGISDYGCGDEAANYNGRDRNGYAYIFTSTTSGTASELATATIYGEDDDDGVGIDGTGLDLDGDGLNDLALSAQGYDQDTSDGAAVVFYGPVVGTLSADDADVIFYAEGTNNYAGKSVDALGDVNHDGFEDLAMGAPQAGEGSAYILWGSATLDTRTLGDAEVTLRGMEPDKHFGYVVRHLDDLNEDGEPELFVSEGQADNSWGYVFFGPFDAGTLRSTDADVTLTAEEQDDLYTTAFTHEDATGDGVADLVIGSYQHGNGYWDGIAYIIDGVGL